MVPLVPLPLFHSVELDGACFTLSPVLRIPLATLPALAAGKPCDDHDRQDQDQKAESHSQTDRNILVGLGAVRKRIAVVVTGLVQHHFGRWSVDLGGRVEYAGAVLYLRSRVLTIVERRKAEKRV